MAKHLEPLLGDGRVVLQDKTCILFSVGDLWDHLFIWAVARAGAEVGANPGL